MKNSYIKILCCLCSCVSSWNFGLAQQDNVTIDVVDDIEIVDNTYIRLNVLAKRNGLGMKGLNATNIEVKEIIQQDSILLEINAIKDTLRRDTLNKRSKNSYIHFLIDVSSTMDSEAINEAKDLIREFTNNYRSTNLHIKFSTFAADFHVENLKITQKNIEKQLNKIAQVPENPDLFRVIRDKLRQIKELDGKSILFVLTNGKNNTRENPRYAKKGKSGEVPLEARQVLDHLELEEDVYFYPIGLGFEPTQDFLQSIVNKTPQKLDSYHANIFPSNLDEVLRNNDNIIDISNYTIDVVPRENRRVFRGEKRTYLVGLKEKPFADTEIFSAGAPTNPVIINSSQTWQTWAFYILFGIALVASILGICSLIVPFLRRSQFKRKYVNPYVPKKGRRLYDPLTKEMIQEGELVVDKCQQVTPFNTWKGIGWHCPEYPECAQNPFFSCGGAGAPEEDTNFFAMHGIYRSLNWLWFGAVGGFIGWLLFSITKFFDLEGYKNIIGYVAKNAGDDLLEKVNIQDIANTTLSGIAFGVGLIFMLAWIEERGQSRDISWGRILLRTFLGALLAALVFFGGFYLLISDFTTNIYLNGLLTWLAFGLVVGLVLSVRSTISFGRAILGGFLASALAYGLYLGISIFLGEYNLYDLVQLLSLVVMGGILGLILEAVVASFEEFELEYISPNEYKRAARPISKWLKSGIEITIGTAKGAYVPIKWEYEIVANEHAKLTYERGKVFITPLAETLVNGAIRPIGKASAMAAGDVIQLGRRSQTRLRLMGKEDNTPKQVPKIKKQDTAAAYDKDDLKARLQ